MPKGKKSKEKQDIGIINEKENSFRKVGAKGSCKKRRKTKSVVMRWDKLCSIAPQVVDRFFIFTITIMIDSTNI